MVVIPLTLMILEWHHPSGFAKDVYDGLVHMASNWKNLHVYQSVLFGLVALGAAWLTAGLHDGWSYFSKGFIFVFAICYVVFDSTAGVAVGSVLQLSLDDPTLDNTTVRSIVQHLYNDPITGGTNSLFSLTGSWTWLLGIVTAIIALWRNNNALPKWKLLPPLLLLLVSAYSLFIGHYSPYGPTAFGTFAAASLWFELFRFGPAQ